MAIMLHLVWIYITIFESDITALIKVLSTAELTSCAQKCKFWTFIFHQDFDVGKFGSGSDEVWSYCMRSDLHCLPVNCV